MADTAPLVSVVMPAYNAARTIRASVESVLTQTLRDIELVVLDDGSTDDTAAVLASIDDSRLRVIPHERNAGLVAMLNEGLEAARAPVVARLDADDEAFPERLARQHAVLTSHPEVGLVVSAYDRFDDDGGPLPRGRWQTPAVHHAGAWLGLLFRNGICHSSAMFRRDLARSLGSYDRDRYPAEDYDLWLRMLPHARYVGIAEPLVRYRVTGSGITGQVPKTMEDVALARSADAIEDLLGEAPDRHVLHGLAFARDGLPAHLFEPGLDLLLRCRAAVAARSSARGIPARGLSLALAPLLLRCGLHDASGRPTPSTAARLATRHPVLTSWAVGVAAAGKLRAARR